MVDVKYLCENCGWSGRKSLKEKIMDYVFRSASSFLLILGVFFLLFIILTGPMRVANMVSSEFMISSAGLPGDSLRSFGINSTSICRSNRLNSNVYCNSFEVFASLKNISYVRSSVYSPIQGFNESLLYGDCKNSAILFVEVMRNLGFSAELVCDAVTEHHCIAVVPDCDSFGCSGEFFVVDLTVPAFYFMDESQDVWDYYDEGERVYEDEVYWRNKR